MDLQGGPKSQQHTPIFFGEFMTITKETIQRIRAVANDARGNLQIRKVAKQKLVELKREYPALFKPELKLVHSASRKTWSIADELVNWKKYGGYS